MLIRYPCPKDKAYAGLPLISQGYPPLKGSYLRVTQPSAALALRTRALISANQKQIFADESALIRPKISVNPLSLCETQALDLHA